MRTQDKAILKAWVNKNFTDPDTIDTEAYQDDTLTLDENKRELKTMFSTQWIDNESTKSHIQEQEEILQRHQEAENQNQTQTLPQRIVEKSLIITILGARGSGKTACGYELLHWHKLHGKRKTYCYKHPSPSILPNWVKNTKSLMGIFDSVILIDESTLNFSQYSNGARETKTLIQDLVIARHEGNTIIFIAQNGGMIAKNISDLTDIWVLKKPTVQQLYSERGIIKALYQQCHHLFSDEHSKRKGAYIIWDDYRDFVYFDLPPFWSEELSKSYGQPEIGNISQWALKILDKTEKKVIGYLERKENQYRKELEAEQ